MMSEIDVTDSHLEKRDDSKHSLTKIPMRIQTLKAINLRRCIRVTKELKDLLDEHRHLSGSFSDVYVKYLSHRRNAPSTVYNRRCSNRLEIMKNCVLQYDHLNERLREITHKLQKIRSTLINLSKNQDILSKLQSRLNKILLRERRMRTSSTNRSHE